MDFEEKTVEEKIIYRGRILTLRKDTVRLPDGAFAEREMIEHGGGSAVLCEKDGKILLVKQFRYPYKEELWEIPAGKREKGEDPKITAFRELAEEGGVIAKSMELMFELYPSPGYTAEVIRIYRAGGITRGEAHPDADEFLSARWVDKKEIKEMISRGEIKDAKTLVALISVIGQTETK